MVGPNDMSKKTILWMSIIAGALPVAFGFILMNFGKAGTCGPADLPAKIGFVLVALPPLLVGGILPLDTFDLLGDTWALAIFDTIIYACVVYGIMAIVQGIKRSKTRGQQPAPPYSESAARSTQG